MFQNQSLVVFLLLANHQGHAGTPISFSWRGIFLEFILDLISLKLGF